MTKSCSLARSFPFFKKKNLKFHVLGPSVATCQRVNDPLFETLVFFINVFIKRTTCLCDGRELSAPFWRFFRLGENKSMPVRRGEIHVEEVALNAA